MQTRWNRQYLKPAWGHVDLSNIGLSANLLASDNLFFQSMTSRQKLSAQGDGGGGGVTLSMAAIGSLQAINIAPGLYGSVEAVTV
jgi:hypothetical protein